MTQHQAKHPTMDHSDILIWGLNMRNSLSSAEEEEVPSNVDEPPDFLRTHTGSQPDFHKSAIRRASERKESLLSIALADHSKPDPEPVLDLMRRRSILSNTSATSTADLTSDGGITSPARTNTPSPPPPTNLISAALLAFGSKADVYPAGLLVKPDAKLSSTVVLPPESATPSTTDAAVAALVKKRCISFVCGPAKPKESANPTSQADPSPVAQLVKPARKCMIKFACPGPKAADSVPPKKEASSIYSKPVTPSKSVEVLRRRSSRSPSLTRKPRHTAASPNSLLQSQRDPVSPAHVRHRKSKYIEATEDALLPSEATRFHEFASDVREEDDWIRKDASESMAKLTIDDTLEKENLIRRLAKEAEEEALEDDDDEDDDEVAGIDSENDDAGADDVDDQDDDDITVEGSDGNETDNEAGFADSDDENDPAGDFQFWTPGRSIFPTTDATMIRPNVHRAASESSIDSLQHMSPIAKALSNSRGRKSKSRRIKIRPGTPDLPDSTDFVCGTLDEDRPLEDAYVSCMEARKREKQFLIPQDIDPSFPTSDPEDNDGNDDIDHAENSEEQIWFQGHFEDSDADNAKNQRRSSRLSGQSPKRLHSPPPKRRNSPQPEKYRHRSPPPPRRLFAGSPQRPKAPPLRHVESPPASPTSEINNGAITFAPLGQRPGLTHTKSLPRASNAFAKRYHEARLAPLHNGADSGDAIDGYSRGAIDIVKGLERKRERRKEKFFQKHCNRARKLGQLERKPLPGKGAERMRELGLLMAGKTGNRIGKAEFVLSI